MDDEAYNHIAAVFRLFRERKLTELRVEEDNFKLHLSGRRPDPAPARAPVPRLRPVPPRHPEPRSQKGRTVAVRSPLIGVFYRAPAADAPAFVEIDDLVFPDQTVCIVEAMKVFNEIKAEWHGKVVAIPVENGKLVQAGDPLVVLEFVDNDQEEG
jgi:acetyl-CoA carboxylase biotin carboxyl carrier protein